jgi:hypothetical protein
LSVADVDGDGAREILADANVMNSNQGFLYGVDASGAAAAGFPLRVDGFTYMNGPVVTDVDGDGDLELLFLSHNGATVKVNLFEMPARGRRRRSLGQLPPGRRPRGLDRRRQPPAHARRVPAGRDGRGAHRRQAGRARDGRARDRERAHAHGLRLVPPGLEPAHPEQRGDPASGEAIRLYHLPSNPIFIGTRLLLQGAVIENGAGAVTNLLGRVIH